MKIISKSNDFILSSSVYTRYLENRSIIVICVMASFTVLNNCKQSSCKSRAPFQNDVVICCMFTQLVYLVTKLTKPLALPKACRSSKTKRGISIMFFSS